MDESTFIQTQLVADSDKLLESAIISNLRMTPEQRIEAHENALQLMLDLIKAGKEARRESQSQSPT
jgi:hypothetical protein